MSAFITGIVSSLFATFIAYLLKNKIFEWYYSLFMKFYPNISGKYEIVYGNQDRQKPWFEGEKGILSISQHGKRITGKYEVFSNSILKVAFILQGFVTPDRIGVINYFDQKHRIKGAGSFVISITGLNESYAGSMTYICSECDNLHNFPVELNAIK
ncbi:MAG: hypothetical protein HGB37_00965 [Candidatus Moranbacteria bacterium]|nr:hypothetical protein [Candidatus Moranbacteria bacterium]